MAALPYMQLYVADYLADTMHLSAEEHGAYLLLIFNYWQTGKPLPDNDKRLANVARLSNERWTDVKQTLIEYFVVVDGSLVHPRVEADLQFVEDKQNKASAAGKASAVVREAKKQAKLNARLTDVGAGVSTDAKQTHQLEPNHIDTDIDTDVDIKKKRKQPSLDFVLFYEKFPVKKSKAQAMKKWMSMTMDLQQIAIDGIGKYIASVPEGISFVHPSTYLNQERWTDELSPQPALQSQSKRYERM